MKRVIGIILTVALVLTGFVGCSNNSIKDKNLLDNKRAKNSVLKNNDVESFSVAYLEDDGVYNINKVFSFTEKDDITFRRALIQNGYFYVNTSISGDDGSVADATIKFHSTVTGEKFYEKLETNTNNIEQVNSDTFYECDNESPEFTTYYAYKLVKNKSTKESRSVESDYAKYAKYVVVEIKMYIFADYKTSAYINYSEEDYKNEVLKVAECITSDNRSPYICDLSCTLSFNGVSCKDYTLVKEFSDSYILMKYSELVSLRVGISNSDESEGNLTAEEYLKNTLSVEGNKEAELFGMNASASDKLIELPFDDGKVTTFDIYNLSADEKVDPENVVAFINDNMKYKK